MSEETKKEYVRVDKDELAGIREEMKSLTAFKAKYDADNEPAQKRLKGIKTKFHLAHVAHHNIAKDGEAENFRPVVSIGKAYKNPKSTSELDDQLLPIWYLDENMEMKKDVVPMWMFLRESPRLQVKIAKQVKERRTELDPKKGGGGEAEKQGAINSAALPGNMADGLTQAYSDTGTGKAVELEVTYQDVLTTIEFLDEPFAGKTYTLPANDVSALNP